jgi:KilA-N domain
MEVTKVLPFKGKQIRIDVNGLICLTDIHRAAGFSTNNKPDDWLRLESVLKQTTVIIEKTSGKSSAFTKADLRLASYSIAGPNGSVWAHENLALGYASYLSPKLAVEIREVFLRYKKSDPSLADELLESASVEANEWAGVRALSRSKRVQFTTTLQAHGVTKFGYSSCTDAVYGALFDNSAKKLKIAKGLGKNDNLRDKMNTDELVAVMFAERLSRERIEEEAPSGNIECTIATKRSSVRVREAIDGDRRDRQKRLIGS